MDKRSGKKPKSPRRATKKLPPRDWAQEWGFEISPQVQAWLNENAPITFEDSVRASRESYNIAREPEFDDLRFDAEETIAALVRTLAEFEERLARFPARSEKWRLVYDEARMKMIQLLLTPSFREDVFARWRMYFRRQCRGTDTGKVNTALLIRRYLEEPSYWLICGLVVAIFERSKVAALAELRESERLAARFRAASLGLNEKPSWN
ncbi:MAG: hypothetical protein HY741_28560 [Chloroflexi bacterium]|nr:hypothetical protein [Chloroflexota bacterium]